MRLIKKINIRFRDLRIRNKFILIFVLFIFIPIVILGYLLFTEFTNTLQEKSFELSQQSLTVLNNNVNNYLKKAYDEISPVLNNGDFITEIIKNEKQGSATYFITEGSICDKLHEILQSKTDFFAAYLYLSSGRRYIAQTGNKEISPVYDPLEEEWIENVEKNKWAFSFVPPHKDRQAVLADTNVVSLVIRQEIKTDPDISVENTKNGTERFSFVTPAYFVFNIELGRYFQIFYRQQKDDELMLVDEDKTVLFCNDINKPGQTVYGLISRDIDLNGSGNIIADMQSEKKLISWQYSPFTKLTTIIIKENEDLIKELDKVKILMFVSIFILLAIFAVMLLIVLKIITNPVNKLASAMALIDSNGKGVKVRTDSQDEIGILGSKYNEMLDQIENLMGEIRFSYEKQKELEYGVLEAQINPHFIYNTLNSIKNVALIQKADTVAMAIKSLISLLQSSIRIGENFIPVREELKQLKDYVVLQSIRYLDSFTVSYDVDEEALSCKTIKFLLQSLVENAIYHGIEPKQRLGVIEISIKRQASRIVYCVKDNGVGMDERKLKMLQEDLQNRENKKGYNKVGLKNIDERIKLYFGAQYGISIHSADGEGMLVKVIIPAIEYEKITRDGEDDAKDIDR